MNPMVKSLLEFNQAFEIPRLDKPGLGPDELIELRIKLLVEEVQEYAEAARTGDLVEVLDAGDFSFESNFELHESNCQNCFQNCTKTAT